jgi:hypothetical protein
MSDFDASARPDACPIPDVHARLNEAHIHWHRALDSYHSPHEFRASLNACIQALRSVTFVLQKNKRAIPEFDAWYAKEQERMRADPVMRWLVEARNRVVKQGDLEARSYAALSILASYDDPPVLVLELDPFTPLGPLADYLAGQELPEHVKEHGSGRVERRWVADDLSEYELLDALGYCYGNLATLVANAHRQSGMSEEVAWDCPGAIRLEVPHETTEWLRGRPRCMIATEDQRSVARLLKSGESFTPRSVWIPAEDVASQEFAERYGLSDLFESGTKVDPVNLRELCEAYYATGCRILEIDRYHDPIALLITPSGETTPVQIMATNQAEKYIVYRNLAKQVRQTGAEALVFIGESWMAPFDPDHPERFARDSPERFEVLALDAVAKSGERISWVRRLERDGDKIRLGPREDCSSTKTPRFLEPVLKVWRESP